MHVQTSKQRGKNLAVDWGHLAAEVPSMVQPAQWLIRPCSPVTLHVYLNSPVLISLMPVALLSNDASTMHRIALLLCDSHKQLKIRWSRNQFAPMFVHCTKSSAIAEIAQISGNYAVKGHSRSLIFIPIESPCATCCIVNRPNTNITNSYILSNSVSSYRSAAVRLSPLTRGCLLLIPSLSRNLCEYHNKSYLAEN